MVRRLMVNIPKHLVPITGIRRRRLALLLALLLLSFGYSVEIRSIVRAQEEFRVTSADDSENDGCGVNECTLREAIDAANNNDNAGETDFITFNIGSGPQTITLGSDLPTLVEPVFIDGFSQGDGSASCDSPFITIVGGGASNGLQLGTGSDFSTIQGVEITGTTGSAILIESSDNLIQCNTLSGNAGAGVSVADGTGNTINSNRIYNNGGLGIDLAAGTNDDQPAPVFTTVSSDGIETTIEGTVVGAQDDTVEIFSCTVGNAEGENLLGTAFVDATGTAFEISIGALQLTDAVSATITNANGSTSEFSTCQAVSGAPQYISTPGTGVVAISAVENTPQTINVNVSNPGLADLVLDPIDLVGDAEITLLSTAPITVNPGGNTNLQVQCSSDTVNTYTATLTVSHNAAGSPAEYELMCDVTELPTREFDSVPQPGDTINFGQVIVGSSASLNIEIRNAGSLSLDVSAPVLSGDNPGDFSIDPTDLLPKTLPGTSSDFITISCVPQAVDPVLDAVLTLTTTDDDEGTVTYDLLCEGVPAPAQYSSSVPIGSIINVGSSPVGVQVSNPAAFNITNPGGTDLTVSFAVSGGDASNFTVPIDPVVVTAVTGSYDVPIDCTPDAAGLRTTTLTVSHDAPSGSTATYTLNCNGEAPIYSSIPGDGSLLDMGSTPVGTPLTLIVLTITNEGDAPMDVSFSLDAGDALDFTVNTGDSTIPADGTLDVSVTCDTTVGALRETQLIVNHTAAGNQATYPLRCTGLAATYVSTPNPGGTINVGTSSVGVQTTNANALHITNNGSAPLNVSFSVAGDDAGDFAINTAATAIAANGGTLDLSISCTPSAPGPRTTTLTVDHDAPAGSSATYTLNCTGLAPVYASTPGAGGPIDVGTSQVGSPITNANALTISNNGDGPMTVSFALVGGDAAEFAVLTPNGTIVNPGTPVNVSIRCTPTDASLRTTTLQVTHNDPVATSPVSYTVNCTGIAAGTPAYDSTPTNGQTLDVGTTPVGTPFTNATVLVITNTGTAPLTLSFDLSGGDALEFTLNTADQSLGSGDSLNVSISCTPTAPTSRTTTLTVNHDAAGNPAFYPVTCTGTTVAAPIYSSVPAPGAPLDIGSADVGLSNTNANALTITNTGTAPLTVGFATDNTEFVVDTPGQAINAGVSLTVSITCTPTDVGGRSGTLTVTHDAAGTPATYPLSCTGTTPPTGAVYSSTPTDGTLLTIGSAVVGTPVSNNTALTITNTGTAPMTVSFATDNSEYVVNTPGQVINAGVSLTVSITCTPIDVGARIGTLTVTHDAGGSPATYPLGCTGITAGYTSTPAPNGTINVGSALVNTIVTNASALVINNTSSTTFTVSFALGGGQSGEFVVNTANNTPVNPGVPVNVSISCTPGAVGGRTTTLTVTHTSPGSPSPVTYTLNCTGNAPGTPIYRSAPSPGSTINVGTVQIGTAISTNLLIDNPGTAALSVLLPQQNALITGVNAPDFAIITNPPPFSVYPSNDTDPTNPKSIAVTIRCIPTIAGLEVAVLTFRTTDPNQPTVSYNLACTGSGTPVSTATPIGFIPTVAPFEPTPVPPATGTVSNEVKGLAMRTGPYLGATLLGGIRPGAPFAILARSNDESPQFTWYLVTDANGVTGWVSGRYLQVTGNIDAVPFQGNPFDTLDNAPDIGVTARAMSIIDIRRRPSGRTTILGQVPQDAVISIIGRTRQNGGDFWVQIRYNGIVGWIPAAPIDVHGTTANVPIR